MVISALCRVGAEGTCRRNSDVPNRAGEAEEAPVPAVAPGSRLLEFVGRGRGARPSPQGPDQTLHRNAEYFRYWVMLGKYEEDGARGLRRAKGSRRVQIELSRLI